MASRRRKKGEPTLLGFIVAITLFGYLWYPSLGIQLDRDMAAYVFASIAVGLYILANVFIWVLRRRAIRNLREQEYRRWMPPQQTTQPDSLDRPLYRLSPSEFEHEIAWILEQASGYSGRVVGGSGDGGIDIRMFDKTGMLKAIVQCKRYTPNSVVPPKDLREFDSARRRLGVQYAVFATTARFSLTTQREALQLEIQLMDGEKLETMRRKAYMRIAMQKQSEQIAAQQRGTSR